jgi:arabinogalactan oligomer/maltooligosaccharide transport system substrate-binding protein
MKTKRMPLLVICLFAGLSTLTGCNNSRSGKIVIWHDKTDAVVKVLSDAIKEQLPNENVEFVHKDSLTDTLKLVGNDANSAPDMFIFAHDKIGLFKTIGILEPMDELVDPSHYSDYESLTLSAMKYEDVRYGIPLYYETTLFLYNKELLSSADVPTTTEKLYAYMKDNTDARRYGFVEQHSTPYYSAAWINGFGGSILHDDGKPGLNDKATIDSLTYHRKFVEYMPKTSADYSTVNTLFLEKSADCVIGGPWMISSAKEANIDIGVAPMPIIDCTGKALSPYCGVQGVYALKVATKEQERKERISKILKLFTDPQIGGDLALTSGCAPANKKSYEISGVKNNEIVKAIVSSSESAIPMPSRPEMDIMWLETGKLLSDVNMKGADIASSCEKYQKEAENLISQM